MSGTTPSGPPPAGPPEAPQFEFNAEQNALMGDLGAKMQFVGTFAIVIGVLGLIGGVLVLNTRAFNPGALILSLLDIAVGAWIRSAGGAFREVVQTRGADITHLMDALGDLRRVAALFYWIGILTIALLVISLILLAIYPDGARTIPEAVALLPGAIRG